MIPTFDFEVNFKNIIRKLYLQSYIIAIYVIYIYTYTIYNELLLTLRTDGRSNNNS